MGRLDGPGRPTRSGSTGSSGWPGSSPGSTPSARSTRPGTSADLRERRGGAGRGQGQGAQGVPGLSSRSAPATRRIGLTTGSPRSTRSPSSSTPGIRIRPRPRSASPTRLLVDDVAVDHPDVRFVLAHFGNPWLIDAAEVVYKNDNVWADLSGLIVGDEPCSTATSGRPGRSARSTTRSSTSARRMRYVGKPDRFLFGSDWPLAPMPQYRKLVEAIVPRSAVARRLRDNAKAFPPRTLEMTEDESPDRYRRTRSSRPPSPTPARTGRGRGRLRGPRPRRTTRSRPTARARSRNRPGPPRPIDHAPTLEAIGALGEALHRKLDALQTLFDREIRAEATREKVVDRLHAELQEYKQGLILGILRPVFVDLIQLHDDIGKMVAAPGDSEGERRPPARPDAGLSAGDRGHPLPPGGRALRDRRRRLRPPSPEGPLHRPHRRPRPEQARRRPTTQGLPGRRQGDPTGDGDGLCL